MTVPELEALEKKMLAPMQADKAGGQRHRAAEASGAELIAPILLILFGNQGDCTGKSSYASVLVIFQHRRPYHFRPVRKAPCWSQAVPTQLCITA
jgi:hypothetical protein